MFSHPASVEFAIDLHVDDTIADYNIHKAQTNDEIIYMTSPSGQVADLIDDEGIISYSIYSNADACEHGEYDHIGAIADDADRKEFLRLFK